MTSRTRARRLLQAARHVTTAVRKVIWVLPRLDEAGKRSEIVHWSARALDIFNLTPADYAPRGGAARRPCLYVANHVSWVDVLAVWASFDTRFVAKTEVAQWPVFGFLARRLDVIFIDRSRRSDTRDAVKIIADALRNGRSVCVFPEGTSTEGNELRPFHSSLFQAAIDAGVHVQPIAIRYLRPDHTRAPEAAFVGDATLLRSMWQLAGAAALKVDIAVLEPIATERNSRRDLAQAAEAQIRSHLSVPAESEPPARDRAMADVVGAVFGAEALSGR